MSQAVLVLGMHRSGTSCLAGSLQEAGLFLGNVSTRGGRHNPRGNRESVEIMRFHESLLRDNGGSWDAPPTHLTWSDEHRKRRDAIIASYGDTPFWGFKDPRSVLTLEMWREAIPELRAVGTFRHPMSVALSLENRHGGPRKKWLDLWMLYNERLVLHQQELGFPLLSFDLADAEYATALRRIANEIGLRAPDEMDFFEPALRRQRHVASDPLPPRVAELYARLEQIAQREPGARPHGGIPAT